ncbi:telomerase protein component 1-like isoform X2 [Salarias fasciatus]|uniref:telomerase protein component 1-like isoform X2 n=1 Tax=Salarias fasciatus TaxID=181472 RepID=UPI00117666E1|nr:telomerase protein component 1-like isoform X2 [Salarias fasciatus]
MKALTVQQPDVAPGQQPQQTSCGRSLTSNYSPPNLENKYLAQASVMKPESFSPLINVALQPTACPSLQPSALSSTSSSLLSTSALASSLSSPLLSTQNKFLTTHSLRPSFSLTSSITTDTLLTTTMTSGALISRFAQPVSFLPQVLGKERKDADGEEEREETPDVMESSFEETSESLETHDVLSQEETMVEETDAPGAEKLQASDTPLEDEDYEDIEMDLEDEFPELDGGNKSAEEELQNQKYLLLNAVSSSLVMSTVPPGQKTWKSKKNVWRKILKLVKDISSKDPEFILKVALYTRQRLNIRITANFLLALAASLDETKSHVRRYFCAAVQLPSDWLEVVRIYTACFKRSLPSCLKKAMVDKFKQFSEYQLAKYNTRKHRCKHNRNKLKGKKPSSQQLKLWANKLGSDETILTKFLQLEQNTGKVEKKQSEFSLKKLIKRLHIKEPAEYVMAILGRKYPSDQRAFSRSGLKGEWDPDKAGQRMKLQEPQTWERLVSREGNKAATWEKLIDNKSLPFMAMLRNLRNMITAGISEQHHNKILKRLTDKKAVMESRQFPFRFLAAYKVMLELLPVASATQPATASTTKILRGILKKVLKSSHFSHRQWEKTRRSRLKVTLGVPFIYRLYQQQKAQLKKAREKVFTVALLDRYRKALETAVQISCRYNLPPLPGRTVILLYARVNSFLSWLKKQDFCLPPDPEQKDKKDDEDDNDDRRKNVEKTEKLGPSGEEVAALVALLIRSSAEDCQFCLVDHGHCEEIKLKSDVLLDNVRTVVKQMKTCQETSYESKNTSFYSRLFSKENKVDNIIMLTDNWFTEEVEWEINSYRANVNRKAVVMQIFLEARHSFSKLHPGGNTVWLVGFNEQILRFVSERGSSRLLEHVEHLDRLHNIKPAEGAKGAPTTKDVAMIPPSPKLRWKGVRVFISSTFRDMHSERDVLVQSVFPELRRRAAPHCLYLQEVELRWGVTEEESERATELCLSEVCRNQILVGILGERYGQVPDRPALPDLPQYSWLATAPEGLSVTEMEIRQFQSLYPGVAHERMFCYFRDPAIIKSVPVAWRSHFTPESNDAEQKMTTLKNALRDSNVKVTENYSCEWGGVVDGKPHLTKLDEFGKAVLEDLWTAVKKLFVDESEEREEAAEVYEQEVHQGALQRQFFGRSKLLSAAVEMVEQLQTKGHMMVVEGGAGEGKTLFMAGLAEALRTGQKSRRNLVCRVVSYSTAASQSARSGENLVGCLVQLLRKIKDTQEESPLPRSYKDLLAEFHSTLTTMTMTTPLVLLIDGVDLIRDGRGQLSCDWLPPKLPKGVCLVVSMTSKAPLLQTLVKKTGTVLFSLGPLTVPDRREIVKKELDAFGKKLSDSAFNSQLQTLIMKKGALSPLYLHLACEDLRNFASFDRLKENVLGIPGSLSQLVQYSLERLCSHYRDMQGLRWALAVLTVSTTGLKERDLYAVLNTCNSLSSQKAQVTWQEVLQLYRKPTGRIPMAAFTRIVHSLQSLMDPSHCYNTSDLLTLKNVEVKRAFEDFLLPAESETKRAHLILAAHLWTRADPEGQETFFHCEVNSVMHLPQSLIESGQMEAVESLLSNYYFLYANVRNGLLQHLMDMYDLYKKESKSGHSRPFCGNVWDCHNFLWGHSAVLSSWPALFIQEALHCPPETSAQSWAKGLVGKGGNRIIECRSRLKYDPQEFSMLRSTLRSEPTCVALSPDKLQMVVGSCEGMLHFLNVQTGLEVKSLVSNCDGISSCMFVEDGRLATTSFDGRIELWDVENGCRTALIEGHNNAITASNISADKKHLVTVSLDFKLKVWSSTKGHEVASLSSISPLNCVTFDPEAHLLAAGCWNGDVMVWNWLQNQQLPLLRGHQRSVRSLAFSSTSSMLCSGSISGEVRVWSVPTSTCVGCFQAHDGATEALSFLEEELLLLTAGSDHTIRLWSGGLGRSVATLKSVEEPTEKGNQLDTSGPAALCVAAHGDYVAVGYHLDSINIFSLHSGEKIQSIEFIELSIHCMLWVVVETKKEKTEVLVFSGSDRRLRVYNNKEGSLEYVGMFASQSGVVLAMAQNSTYLATASEDHTVALWRIKTLAHDPPDLPCALLKGHSKAVTCLAFSPDGKQLLSGGKDRALMLWDVSSVPGRLSKPLHHAHRDWITGCAWTDGCVVSSSDDGRLCFWDLEAGQCIREISWKSPLTSVCCLGEHVIAGSADGELHVWEWETKAEVSHIAAHKQRINHCCLQANTDKTKEIKPGEMTVFTASNDGMVKVWKPLQVEHIASLHGHSGAVQGFVLREEFNEIITVSGDRSVRMWASGRDYPKDQKNSVAVMSYSENGEMFVAGYESGLVEVWRHHAIITHKQVSDSPITAACFMPKDQLAISNKTSLQVDVWEMMWNEEHNKASLVKATSYKVKEEVQHLFYCSALLGVSCYGRIFEVSLDMSNMWESVITNWHVTVRIHAIIRDDDSGVWLLGEEDGTVVIGFLFSVGSKGSLSSAFSTVTMKEGEIYEEDKEEEEEQEGDEEEETTDEKEEEEEKAKKAEEDQKDEDMEDEEEKLSQLQENEKNEKKVESQEEKEEEESGEQEEEEDSEDLEEEDSGDQEDKEYEEEQMGDLDEKEEGWEDEENEDLEHQEEDEEEQNMAEQQEEKKNEEQSQEENEDEEQSQDREDEEEEEEEDEQERKELQKGESLITALTKDREFVVCGDMEGNMWFNRPPEGYSWSNKKLVHSDRITQLRLTDTTIISASLDRTVKLWDRSSKKQVGMFVCEGPVLVLEVNPAKPTELICGDGYGLVYILSWKE